MKKLGAILPLAGAAVGGVVAVVGVSQIALTFDALQSPVIRAIYAAMLVVVFAGLGGFAYRRLRRPPEKPSTPSRRPPPEDRLKRLFARHGLDAPGEDASPAVRRPSSVSAGRPLTIALCGLARTGKTKLIERLRPALPARIDGREVRLLEVPSLGVDFAQNLERLQAARSADVILFVADQDLRDYEFAALRSLAKRGIKPLVVVNKADRMDATALTETEASIASKLRNLLSKDDIVSAAADPMPRTRVLTDGGGVLIEEEIAQPADVGRVVERLVVRARRQTGHA